LNQGRKFALPVLEGEKGTDGNLGDWARCDKEKTKQPNKHKIPSPPPKIRIKGESDIILKGGKKRGSFPYSHVKA